MKRMKKKQLISMSLVALMLLSIVAIMGTTVASAAPKEKRPLDTPQILTPSGGTTIADAARIIVNAPAGFSWTAVKGATSYQVKYEISDGAGGWSNGYTLPPDLGTTLNFPLFSTEGQLARWSVMAASADRVSAWSEYRYVTVVAPGLPTATVVSPSSLIILGGDGVSKTFSWNPVDGANNYAIAFTALQFSNGFSNPATAIASYGPYVVGDETTYTTDTTFLSSSYLLWNVMAQDTNTVGATSWSISHAAIVVDKLTSPVITSPKDGAKITAGEHTFSWKAVPGTAGLTPSYEWKMTTTDGTIIDGSITSQTSLTVTLTGPSGNTFELSVRAVYGTGAPPLDVLNSDWSSVVVTVK